MSGLRFTDFIREYSTESGSTARAAFNSEGRLYFALGPLFLGYMITVILMIVVWPIWVLWRATR